MLLAGQSFRASRFCLRKLSNSWPKQFDFLDSSAFDYAQRLMDRVLANNSTVVNRRSSLTTPDKLLQTPQINKSNKENTLQSPTTDIKHGPLHSIVTARNASTAPNGQFFVFKLPFE